MIVLNIQLPDNKVSFFIRICIFEMHILTVYLFYCPAPINESNEYQASKSWKGGKIGETEGLRD
jgi:hypothetical protein